MQRKKKVSFCSSFVYRNCSSGEGIFTFYCRRSRELVARLTATSKNQPLSSIEGKKSSHYKMNPILALLRRGSSSSSSTSNSGNHNSRSKSKKHKWCRRIFFGIILKLSFYFSLVFTSETRKRLKIEFVFHNWLSCWYMYMEH